MMLWTAISPVCLLVIGVTWWLMRLNWYPTTDLRISIVIYLSYWLLLGLLQGALLFKFQRQALAYKWFLTTSITGFLIMLCHDLSPLVFGTDTRGQGILYLLVSLPCLAVLGGAILGLAQFLLIESDRHLDVTTNFRTNWFVVSFISWILSFIGILFGPIMPLAILVLATVGTAIKGYAVMERVEI